MLPQVRVVIRAHGGKSAAMVIRKLIVRITMFRAEHAGNARMASRGAIGFDFNPMSQAARNIPSGGRADR